MTKKAKSKAGRKPSPEAAKQATAALEALENWPGNVAPIREDIAAPRRIEKIAPPPTISLSNGGEHALRAWEFLTEHLQGIGLWNDTDIFALEILCKNIGVWHWCREKIADKDNENPLKRGVRVYASHGRNGTQEKRRALVQEEMDAEKQILRLCGDFGITPAARARILNLASPTKPQGQSDLFDE